MAKKSRRARQASRNTSSKSSSQSAVQKPGAAVSPEEENAADFPEYAYVVADLRRVGILAAAMFALLVALSFFIG